MKGKRLPSGIAAGLRVRYAPEAVAEPGPAYRDMITAATMQIKQHGTH
jgi:hypothetical protein